jgi:hypothetical protein
MKTEKKEVIYIRAVLDYVFPTPDLIGKSVNVFAKYNWNPDKIKPLEYCAGIKNGFFIRNYFGFENGTRFEKDSLFFPRLLKPSYIKIEIGPKGQATANESVLLDVSIQYYLGIHASVKALIENRKSEITKLETATMQEIEKHIRGNAEWTEFMKSKPERDQDPRDYMVRRSGWILPGHFGGKSGG